MVSRDFKKKRFNKVKEQNLAQKEKACYKCKKQNKYQKARFVGDYVIQTEYKHNLGHKGSVEQKT